jgi:D-sedoheptulose 7-phosphate isomerase
MTQFSHANQYITDSIEAISSLRTQEQRILDLSQVMAEILRKGGCIYWAGNGGSAADSQHLAAELVGRFEIERRPLRSIALTTDSSVLTAVGNDYGFEEIFARQIRAHVKSEDLVIFISTSGKSQNILRGLDACKSMGIVTAVLTGKSSVECDYLISVNSERTCHIQEAHIVIGQLLCSLVEQQQEKLNDFN